jgi:hypothetical protein
MTPHGFGLVLMGCSALLALWIIARYTAFGPRTVLWAVIHAVVAFVLLRFVPIALNSLGNSRIPGVEWIEIFGIALPLLVYGFLSSGWVARAAIGLLRP